MWEKQLAQGQAPDLDSAFTSESRAEINQKLRKAKRVSLAHMEQVEERIRTSSLGYANKG